MSGAPVLEREGRPHPAARSAGLAPLVLPGPVLIAGAGSIGTRHLRNLRALGVEDVAFYRTSDRPLEAEAPARAYRNLEAALRGRPFATLICNPTSLHLDVARAAARAGSHLFIEKPLSHSADGIEDLERAVRERGLVACVGFQFRFHPTLRRVKSWLEQGLLGEVVSARAHWGEYLPGWHPGEDYRRGYSARRDLGGGALLTLCHPFDYLRFLLGEAESVQAMAGRQSGLEVDVEDVAHVIVRFASGALAAVSLDYVAHPPGHGFEIVGQRGIVRWSGEDGVARLLVRQERARLAVPPPGFSRNTMFLDEMRHFLQCLRGEEAPVCGLEDGVRALRMALAARLAAETGEAVRV
jgi:predicted dehydrogenase